MKKIHRDPGNPILSPNNQNTWEAEAVFNGCVVKEKGTYHLVYRATSAERTFYGMEMELSSIGHARGSDKKTFTDRREFITPEHSWEQFGCEDPRVVKIEDKYLIFYTALSEYPPKPHAIRIGVAITKDFEEVEERHLVTHFNSKAMSLFPEKIGGQYVGVLTLNTDAAQSDMAFCYFNSLEEIWSRTYWENWYKDYKKYRIDLIREKDDHIELGAPPVKTKDGWILIYSHIQDFFEPPATFGIEALLLDLKDPKRILGRTHEPLLIPEKDYELYGKVKDVIFPSGAVIEGAELNIYYGAADTTLCLATLKVDDLIEVMTCEDDVCLTEKIFMKRFEDNPIITPNPDHDWESKFTFNPGAIREDGQVYIIYRAMGHDDTSVFGLARSKDGFHIDERLDEPIYVPRMDFEKKKGSGYSGCEDPRLTKFGDRYYMCYTAFDAANPTHVALTSIKVEDFVNYKWKWDDPQIISTPDRDDKNACLLPKKIDGEYVFFHRIGGCIWIDRVKDMKFGDDDWLGGEIVMYPRPGKWDSRKIGITGPPIETPQGWLLIYHGLSKHDDKYRLGAVLLNKDKPEDVVNRLDYPILEPITDYENMGDRPKTVFSCGVVEIGKELYVYYGGGDKVIGVATIEREKLLKELIV